MNKVANSLLEIGAVGFSVDSPITFTSGMKSPVYVDNRKLPYHPSQWRVIIEKFAQVFDRLSFDVVAGVEAAGIPHSSALGYKLKKPSVFVRKKPKDHGTKSMIEGGSVKGKKVVLIEDLVTTGSSSLKGVKALRKEGAMVSDCVVIVTYGFGESIRAFKEEEVNLFALASFGEILEAGVMMKKIGEKEKKEVERWIGDPWGWR